MNSMPFAYSFLHLEISPRGVTRKKKSNQVTFLTLSDFRTYIYVRNPKTVATPVGKYSYTEWNRNMGASNGHFTVSEHLPHELHTSCFRSGGVHLFTSREKVEFTRVRRCFLEVTIVGPSAIDRCAWNKTANYMDFLP